MDGDNLVSMGNKFKDLWNYTLGHQVCKTYDFPKAMNVAIKEFCPDKLVLFGAWKSLRWTQLDKLLPKQNWQDISCKKDFTNGKRQTHFLFKGGFLNSVI
ncbi:MAG: hypothetical protein CM1200mP10_24040 [Candidatus Neomarinimicrobiota bacterium]|nr:MAG: hypothetical protein CM1200mP10_24040 [Candidatus Neomarinimicrobiota bacterium]